MKVEISRKDILLILHNLEQKLRAEGSVMEAVAIEYGRASIKRLEETIGLQEIRYIDPHTGMFMDVGIIQDDGQPKTPKEL